MLVIVKCMRHFCAVSPFCWSLPARKVHDRLRQNIERVHEGHGNAGGYDREFAAADQQHIGLLGHLKRDSAERRLGLRSGIAAFHGLDQRHDLLLSGRLQGSDPASRECRRVKSGIVDRRGCEQSDTSTA